ncbi:PEGA domain-containing protein [Halpernia humi]|uniref:PEGA domain-containing protein n=1 Tax=Halpernia humi TaxID=493375 RepID=A0A1H5SV97_9FLAO|nr:TonB-dependent receptor [Halpernia humi]SEF54419.1 PEGA domain-containing protein [Halpernia humi]
MKVKFSFLFFLVSYFALSQVGSLNINVFDQFSKKELAATAKISKIDSVYSGNGTISIQNLPSGNYTLEINAQGYETGILSEINVVPNQNLTFSIGLNAIAAKNIDEVIISKKVYKTTAESPLSLRNITSEEIQKNAGSNRDVSKAILSFPGVGSTASFRNDLFIRGGASSENRFYIDDIEVPVINHFQTQGASGGPRGIITVDFLKDVDFYSGAFPSDVSNALSSVFEFHLKQARKDKIGYKAVLGLDDMQLMADGPLSKDQSWSGLFSVRKSNLQILFKAIGLPFLPSYYDSQFKISKKYKSGDELYFIGLGAIDQFKFNDKPKETLSNLTILDRIPKAPQWNYTVGAGYRHLVENGTWLFTLSRNMLNNEATKYYRNIEIPENKLIDYTSQEIENRVKIDRNFRIGNAKISAGINGNFAKYYNKSFIKSVTQIQAATDDYLSEFNVAQFGFYLQGSEKFFNENLTVSAGVRLDGSSYSSLTDNPFKQISPRISLHYQLSPKFALNFNSGIYYQLPTYTALGYKQNGEFINKPFLKYISNAHLVGGVEYNAENNLRFTAEAYYKKYKNYPFSLRNQISLANVGGDFGVVGPEPLDSRGKGETYGFELLAQKRTLNNYYGIAAYTFGYSKFSNANGDLLPSSWDARHILSITGGKYFGRNWNLSARFRLQSGLPETPYNLQESQLVSVWNISNAPVQNFYEINSLRGNLVHQLDVRAEKKWIFKKWQITAYLDVVNIYGSQNPSDLPVVNLARDSNGNGIILNPNAPQDQQIYELQTGQQDRLTPLPYFGLIFEF